MYRQFWSERATGTVHIGQETGWASEADDWTSWRTQKYLSSRSRDCISYT